MLTTGFKNRLISPWACQWHCFSQQDFGFPLVLYFPPQGSVASLAVLLRLPIRHCIVLPLNPMSSCLRIILPSIIWILCHYSVLVLWISSPFSIAKLVHCSVILFTARFFDGIWIFSGGKWKESVFKCHGHPSGCCSAVKECKEMQLTFTPFYVQLRLWRMEAMAYLYFKWEYWTDV